LNQKSQIIIALGSNRGKRLDNLNAALELIFQHLGDLKKLSSVYKTPALGFSGNDFLNACIAVETRFSPQKSLELLLDIESKLGRERSESPGYENRAIDLDILFYEDEIIVEKDLKIPHPQLQNRKFVLAPLTEITPDKVHPRLKKTSQKLLETTPDGSEIKKIDEQLKNLDKPKSNINYLVIEGNIGAGKTTLSEMIAEDYNAKLIAERFRDNPFLPKFYEDRKRFAFPLEMSFLADRYQQLADDIAQLDLFSDFAIADYDAYKSLIFAQVTLSAEEFRLYRKMFDIVHKSLPQPDRYIFLYQKTDRLLENIKKRGRSYEENIPADYLEEIQQGYFQAMKTRKNINTKTIDITELDFVDNREDYLRILDEVLMC
jgi:2-amino-4-hydroxy-6-hydroxymethyldihydropteridine diphosphokinase